MKKLTSILMISGILLLPACTSVLKEQSPNIVFILIDDLGYGDLGCHGNPVINTPRIDMLHDQSIRFTNFAVSPSCAPTRAALMTGKSEFKSNVTHTWEGRNLMDLETVTIAELLKEDGYVTGLFGKWHLGTTGDYRPEHRGFDETLNVPGDNQRSHYDPLLLRNGIEEQHEGYRTDIFFREAMDFIERHKDERFFCYIPTYTPHGPLIVPETYAAPYRNMEHVDAEYCGMVANVDQNVGLLLDKLDALHLEKNTLVIFMSDNGATFGTDIYNAGMRGVKGTAWYGGIRASSFWRWPGKLETGIRPQIAAHVDFLPTLADIAGIDILDELTAQLEGSSLYPLLLDPDAEWDQNRMLIHHRGRWDIEEDYASHKYAFCTVRWQNYYLTRTKLCDDPECETGCRSWPEKVKVGGLYSSNPENYKLTPDGKWNLYNIENDLAQINDIAGDHPEIVEKMSENYDRWWDVVEEKLKESSK